MCLITFKWQSTTRKLELWANRDEFYARPTRPAHLWENQQTWGGVDLQAGGSWLAIQKGGRMAALTNIRQGEPQGAKRSRGDLIRDYCTSDMDAQRYWATLDPSEYGGFNLLLLDSEGLWFGASNQPLIQLESGIYGLSNASLNTPWPKVEAVKNAWVGGDVKQAMRNPEPYPDRLLPKTGIPIEWERRLSAAFIQSEDYGTRAQTYLLLENNQFSAIEQSFGPGADDMRIEISGF